MRVYMKAIVAAAIAFLTSLSTALVDDKSFGDITDGQWVVAVIAFLTALAAVWAVPNTPSE
jgi:hypothetical protein